MARLSRTDFRRRYCTPAGIRAAAARKYATLADRRFVVGGLRMIAGRVVLLAVATYGDGRAICRPIRLTDQARTWHRWRTRQAADQFAKRHRLADVHVYDLNFADVLDGGVDGASSAIDAAHRRRVDGAQTRIRGRVAAILARAS